MLHRAMMLSFSFAASFAFLCLPCAAQEKIIPAGQGSGKPVDPNIKSAGFPTGPAAKELAPGMRITVAPTDQPPVEGTLVWMDKSHLWIRTQPGLAPVKIARAAANNNAIKPVKASGPAKGIKTLEWGGKAIPVHYAPEIHRVEINNGGQINVQYVGAYLSEKEKIILAKLETAENNVANVSFKTNLVDNYIHQQRNLEINRNQALNQYYQHTHLFALGFRPVSQLYPYYIGYPSYAGNYAAPSYYSYGFRRYYRYSGYAAAAPAAYGGYNYGVNMQNPVAGEVISPIKAAVTEVLLREANPAAVQQAQSYLAKVRLHYGRFDNYGHLVAVNYEAPALPPLGGAIQPVAGKK